MPNTAPAVAKRYVFASEPETIPTIIVIHMGQKGQSVVKGAFNMEEEEKGFQKRWS